MTNKSENLNVTKMEKKTEDDESKSGTANFEKLRDDLLHEASQYVADDPSSKIAILMSAPPSSSSSGSAPISLYSFASPSDDSDSIVRKFLAEKEESEEEEEEDEDEEDPKFWWDDGKVLDSNDPEKLKAAIYEITKLRDSLKEVFEDRKKDLASAKPEDHQSETKP